MMFSAISRSALFFDCIKQPRLPDIKTVLVRYARLEATPRKTVSPGLRFFNGCLKGPLPLSTSLPWHKEVGSAGWRYG